MLLSATAEKLEREGVQTLAVVATDARRARTFFRYRRPRMPVGADPDLATHRAYGLPNAAITPELVETVQSKSAQLLRELKQPEVPIAEAYDALGRLDGYQLTEDDAAEAQRDQVQLLGQFLIDRDGVVRWANIECAQGQLAGIGQMPSDEELLAAVRAV